MKEGKKKEKGENESKSKKEQKKEGFFGILFSFYV